MKSLTLITLFLLILVSCNQNQHSNLSKAKNTIFFIGDGMGIATMTASRIYQKGSQGKMNYEKFPYTGFSKTYSTSDFTTDSAASATALATGVKTYNGSIGLTDPKMDQEKRSRILQTILDVATTVGKSVGIITTTRVTHATPACFYAHVPDRDMEEMIARQVASSNLSFLLGGGQKFFYNPEKKIDIISDLKNKGWTYVDNAEDLNAVDNSKKDLKVLGLFNKGHLTYSYDRKGISGIEKVEPTLAQMVYWGIQTLSKNPNGYILIVEAGRIDHASHENHFKRMAEDMLALDEALDTALHKAGTQTLVVATADHETGGLSISGYAPMLETRGDSLVKELKKDDVKSHITWATGPGANQKIRKKEDLERALYFKQFANHTAVDVPVMAAGPGAQLFTGFMNNSDIPKKILKAMDLDFSDVANIQNAKH